MPSDKSVFLLGEWDWENFTGYFCTTTEPLAQKFLDSLHERVSRNIVILEIPLYNSNDDLPDPKKFKREKAF